MAGERLQPGLAVMPAAVLKGCCVKKQVQNVFPRGKLAGTQVSPPVGVQPVLLGAAAIPIVVFN